MSEVTLKFPILRINEFQIERFDSMRQLEAIPKRFYERGEFKRETYIIDASCRKFDVIDAFRVDRHWFWENLPRYLGARQPIYKVRYTLSDPVQLSLEDVKLIVVDLVIKNKWYRQGGETEKKFRKAFVSFKNISELMSNVSLYGKYLG